MCATHSFMVAPYSLLTKTSIIFSVSLLCPEEPERPDTVRRLHIPLLSNHSLAGSPNFGRAAASISHVKKLMAQNAIASSFI